MKTVRNWLFLFAAALCLHADPKVPDPQTQFLVKPYIQLGDRPKLARKEGLTLVWHSRDVENNWSVEIRKEGEKKWRVMPKIAYRRIRVRSIEAHRVYTAEMTGLSAGAPFHYRVLVNGGLAFESSGRARRAAHQFYRFAVFGDCGAGTPGQRAVAYQVYEAKPDFVFIPGDIVYSRGRVSEYAAKYFPVYNADSASAQSGAPLIRSTLFVASPGNHDIASTDFTTNPDAMAYFYNWVQPMNGPELPAGDPSMPALKGAEADRQAFTASAGAAYPRMASFSFDYGNAHWTVLDSNKNVNWNAEQMREWLEKDLKGSHATWKFVAFHHPGFNSSKAHFADQWMRDLSPLFEKYKVDVVWAGHVHNYQRSYPMRYAAGKPGETPTRDWFILDRQYNGETVTKSSSPIYIVSGAGGAGLYNPEQQPAPGTWQPFTLKFIADRHSFTLVDVKGKRLTVRQLASNGDEIDRFVLTK